MSTDKHGNSRTLYLYIFQAAKNSPAFNMIGSRVTVDAPREQKQLEAFGKMSGLSGGLFLSFPDPPPCYYFFVTSVPELSRDSTLPERKRKRLLRRLDYELFNYHAYKSRAKSQMALAQIC